MSADRSITRIQDADDVAASMVTGDVTLGPNQGVVVVSGTRTITLPTAVGCNGRRYLIVRSDTSTLTFVTVLPQAGQTIDGQAKMVVNKDRGVLEVASDGTAWRIVGYRRADVVYPELFGAIGNGTTDDLLAVQAAAVYAQQQGLWLDGAGKTYAVGQPLFLPSSSKVRGITLSALAGFAPADTNNAMVIPIQGVSVACTGAATTDVITCASAHGIPSDGGKVALQGAGLPTPLVSGRVYYAYQRTATTFKVAATVGGAIIDLTADGGGTCYSEVRSLTKLQMHDVYLKGNDVAGLNGLDCALQQQSDLIRVRVDHCPGFGLQVNGQQAEFFDLELIGNGWGLQLDAASFMHFFGFNCESFVLGGVRAVTAAPSTCEFHGVHMEAPAPATADVTYFDFTLGGNNLKFDGVHLSMTHASNQVGFDMGTAGQDPVGYEISNLRASGPSTGSNVKLVRDNVRGKTVYAWNDASGASANNAIRQLLAPHQPTADAYTDEYGGLTVWGKGGKEVRIGSQRDGQPTVALTPGSAQTADQLRANDAGGTQKMGVDPSGKIWLPQLNLGSAGGPGVYFGSGSPNGVVTAPVGSLYLRSDGGTDTSVYRKEAGAGNTGWVASQTPQQGVNSQPYYKTGLYYGPPGPLSTGSSWSNNRAYFLPFVVGVANTFDRIGINVTGVGNNGVVLRLGFYADDPVTAKGPGALLLDAGTVAADAAAGAGAKEITVSRALAAGLNWLVVVPQALTAAPTLTRVGLSPQSPLGIATIPQGSTGAAYADGVSGALPNPAPTVSYNLGSFPPMIYVRSA